VLAAPDDVELNQAYARSETAAGHLLSAAAAYERILILHPERDSIRLAYAEVLYQLDDRPDALEQLRILNPRNLTAAEQAKAGRYLRQLEWRSRNSFSGYVGAGAIYQTDAFGQFYSQLNLPTLVRSKPGADGLVSGAIDDRFQLSGDGRTAAYVSAFGYVQSPISGPDTRYYIGEARVGLTRSGARSAWTLGGVRRQYWLFGAPYLAETGGQAKLALAAGPRVALTTSIEAVAQHYDEPSLARSLGGHDGPRYDANLAVSVRTRGRQTAALAGGYEGQSAGYGPFAYDAPYVRASYTVPLGEAGWLSASGERRRITGRAPDPVFLSGARRDDVMSSVHLDWTAPLGRLLDPAGRRPAVDNLSLQAGVGYDRRKSAPPLAGYESVSGRVQIVWRFQSRQ
jgi:hypothetical protein